MKKQIKVRMKCLSLLLIATVLVTIPGLPILAETATAQSEINYTGVTEEREFVQYADGSNQFEEYAVEVSGKESAEILYSGVSGDLNWSIDGDGVLLIEGTGDYHERPWAAYGSDVTKVIVRVDGITSMERMFWSGSKMDKLTEIDIKDLDTSQVKDMSYTFYGCSNLKSIDMSGLNTSQVTTMERMFYGCSSLSSMDMSKLDTSQLKNVRSMFNGCDSLRSIDISGLNTSQVTSMEQMFYGCSNLGSIDISGLNTSQVASMEQMFYGCSNLGSIDISGLNTSQVTTMEKMFYGCSSLSSMDMSKLDTSQVTSMKQMFYGCSNLSSIDMSGLNTSQVTTMEKMFYGCSSLSSMDMSKLDTSQLKNVESMFSGCNGLSSIDISGLDTSQVADMYGMFMDCRNLSSIDISSWNMGQVTAISCMFYGCSNLSSIDMSNLDLSQVANVNGMFQKCDNLTTIVMPSNLKVEVAFPFVSNYVWKDSDGNRCSEALIKLDVPMTYTRVEEYYGTRGDLAWTIDIEGVLKIEGAGGYGNYAGIVLPMYKEKVKKAIIKVSEITDMSWAFSDLCNMECVDFSETDTSKVTDMSDMFYGCISLTSVDMSAMDMSRVIDASWMFQGCENLKTIKMPANIQTEIAFPNIPGMVWLDSEGKVCQYVHKGLATSMEYVCSDKKAGGISGALNWKVTVDNVLIIEGNGDYEDMPWRDYNGSLSNISVNVAGITSTENMFADMRFSQIDLSNMDMSQVTNAEDMFCNCSNLRSITLPANIQTDIELPRIYGAVWMDSNETICYYAKTNLSTPMTYTLVENVYDDDDDDYFIDDDDEDDYFIDYDDDYEDNDHIIPSDGVTIKSITPIDGTIVNDNIFFWHGEENVRFQVELSNGDSFEIDEWGRVEENYEEYEDKFSFDFQYESYGSSDSTAFVGLNDITYEGKGILQVEVLADDEENQSYAETEKEITFEIWNGIKGNVIPAEKGKKYECVTSANKRDYLLISGIKGNQYYVRYLNEIQDNVKMNFYYDNLFSQSYTLKNNEKGIKDGEYGYGNEKNILTEANYTDYCLVSCENGEEELKYSLQYAEIPTVTNVVVDNDSPEWIKAGGLNWSGVYGWPLNVTYSDGSEQHIWGSRYFCNATEDRHINTNISHDDYGNCFIMEQIDDSVMFDETDELIGGIYPVKITVGSQSFQDNLIVKGNIDSVDKETDENITDKDSEESDTNNSKQPVNPDGKVSDGEKVDNGNTDSGSTDTEKNDNKNQSQTTGKQQIAVQSIFLAAPSKKIAAGKKVQLSVDVTPSNATNQAVSWTSSNETFATVDANGKVTLNKAGAGKKVTITATTTDGSNVQATYTIKIMKHAVKKIKLSSSSKNVKAGKSIKLTTTLKTTGKKANKSLLWTTSNPEYATVDKKGKVQTKKAGKGKTVTITAMSTDGTNKKAKIKIKIK